MSGAYTGRTGSRSRPSARAGRRGLPPRQYCRRGEDAWLQVSWDEANDYIARGLLHIADKYAGEEGHKLLREQGYPEPLIRATHGAGTQVLKIRPGMSLHGALRLQALKRFSNMLAIYDARQRGVDPEEALGARSWTNYDWHGDLPPGHPMVTGIPAHDDDHNNFPPTKLC